MENIKKYILYLLLGLLIYFCSHLTVNAADQIEYTQSRFNFRWYDYDTTSKVINATAAQGLQPVGSTWIVEPNSAGSSFPIGRFVFDVVGTSLQPKTEYKITVKFTFLNDYTGIYFENGIVDVFSCNNSLTGCDLVTYQKIDNETLVFYLKTSSSTVTNFYISVTADKSLPESGVNLPLSYPQNKWLLTNISSDYNATQYFKVSSLTIQASSELDSVIKDQTSILQSSINNLNESITSGMDKIRETIKIAMDSSNQHQTEIKDYLTDDSDPSADISSLGNVQGLLPPGPIDSLLNIPFEFLSILINSLSGTCVPLSGTFVFDKTFTIPCFESLYDEFPDSLMIFIDILPSAFLLIKYFKNLYKKVDRAVSLETSADDEWGCL